MEKMSVQLTLEHDKTIAEISQLACQLVIYEAQTALSFTPNQYYLATKDGQLQDAFLGEESSKVALTDKKIIELRFSSWETNLAGVIQNIISEAQGSKIKLGFVTKLPVIPGHQLTATRKLAEDVLEICSRLGYPLVTVKKKKPAKAQHRWTKEIKERIFTLDNFDAKAQVIWQKRQEMLIKKGARLRKEVPLNKDGSLGLGAKMGTTYREEHKSAIQDFITTEDIVLKSVNEVGLFLYYGGTNGWLELKDQQGKTIDEWTRVD